MAILIGSSSQKKVFNKNIISIGSTSDCDFVMNIGKDKLYVQYSEQKSKYILVNRESNPYVLFKGQTFKGGIVINNVLKLTIANSEDFIIIKMVELPLEKNVSNEVVDDNNESIESVKVNNVQSETNVSHNKNNDVESVTLILSPQEKNENLKTELDAKRARIIKQVGFAISDIKNRLSLNNKASIFTHIALVFSSLVTAFGVSNFITGLKIEESANFINLPTNIKILVIFTILVFGLCLMLKQGIFLDYQNAKFPQYSKTNAQSFLLTASTIFFIAVYAINLIYYININPAFSVLMSLFFVGLSVVLSCTAGYFKCTGHAMAYELDKYEYREDFEAILNNYRHWIDKFINLMSESKIDKLKDRLFNKQIKSVCEIIIRICTAPFLAYGVSNTLALCFPEAAGWIRISGFRFSPVFLTLATFMIVFAFFSFVNAFLNVRKIQASEVIKHDGFNDYLKHGVEILGIQAVKKLENDKMRSLAIGCVIIFIEFTMNMSYFAGEIGGDLQGLLLSVIAALVPTALLIAETYMLSKTKFDICTIEDLLEKKE